MPDNNNNLILWPGLRNFTHSQQEHAQNQAILEASRNVTSSLRSREKLIGDYFLVDLRKGIYLTKLSSKSACPPRPIGDRFLPSNERHDNSSLPWTKWTAICPPINTPMIRLLIHDFHNMHSETSQKIW